jgi:hypothetical protein
MVETSMKTLPLLALTAVSTILFSHVVVTGQPAPLQNPAERVLEDFSKGEPDGFPQGWQASRNEAETRKAYVIQRDGDKAFLKTKGVNDQMRIFKRVGWNPKEYPIVTWRWRLRSALSGESPFAAVFVSLDTDLLVIPVSTKYLWAASGNVGTIKEGGFFGAAEVVVRAGPQPIGQWVEERVNAYSDFLKIHKHEPAPQAWGISLVAGPGIELDFGSIKLAKQ